MWATAVPPPSTLMGVDAPNCNDSTSEKGGEKVSEGAKHSQPTYQAELPELKFPRQKQMKTSVICIQQQLTSVYQCGNLLVHLVSNLRNQLAHSPSPAHSWGLCLSLILCSFLNICVILYSMHQLYQLLMFVSAQAAFEQVELPGTASTASPLLIPKAGRPRRHLCPR